MKEKRILTVKNYSSPFGPLLVGAINDRLCLCDWRTEKHSLPIDERIQRRLIAMGIHPSAARRTVYQIPQKEEERDKRSQRISQFIRFGERPRATRTPWRKFHLSSAIQPITSPGMRFEDGRLIADQLLDKGCCMNAEIKLRASVLNEEAPQL